MPATKTLAAFVSLFIIATTPGCDEPHSESFEPLDETDAFSCDRDSECVIPSYRNGDCCFGGPPPVNRRFAKRLEEAARAGCASARCPSVFPNDSWETQCVEGVCTYDNGKGVRWRPGAEDRAPDSLEEPAPQ